MKYVNLELYHIFLNHKFLIKMNLLFLDCKIHYYQYHNQLFYKMIQMINVGFIHCGSISSDTNLSINLA